MSVKIEVELDNGTTMGYERSVMQMGSASPARALSELDKGYEMIREWLVSQLSPADQAKLRGSRPEPERRIKDVVREAIQDDAKAQRGWRV